MHIRNCHTQKTQPPHTAKKEEREREHVYIIKLISKGHHKQLRKREPLDLPPWNGQ
jgi:hypothetical protein